MLAHESHEGCRIRLPIRRESLEVLEDRADAGGPEQRDGVLGVFVEVGVEYTLIHEIGLPLDWEEQPAEIMQLQDLKAIRLLSDRLFDRPGVFVELLFTARARYTVNVLMR